MAKNRFLHFNPEEHKMRNKQRTKRKGNWKIYLIVLIGLLIFGVGVLAGIQIGTYAIIDHVAYGLAGSTFIVNFNETRLVNQLVDKFIPIINQSLSKQKGGVSIPPNTKGIGYP